MRHWKMVLLVTAIAAVALTIVAVAYAKAGDDASARPGRGAACGVLMDDPQALEAMQQLRAEHRRDMGEWWQKYGADPTSAVARKALRALRQEHLGEMRELLEKAGVDVPDDFGTRAGGRAGCSGGPGGGGACPGGGAGCGRGGASGPQGSGYGGMMDGMMGGGWSY